MMQPMCVEDAELSTITQNQVIPRYFQLTHLGEATFAPAVTLAPGAPRPA